MVKVDQVLYQECENKNLESEPPCICEGNWCQIIKDVDHLIGKQFYEDFDDNKTPWIFQGVLWAEDDFYYLFKTKSGQKHIYVTCCVTLEQAGMRIME